MPARGRATRLGRRLGLLLGALLAAGGVRAQAPAWQTAVVPSGSGTSSVYATGADASGNVYLAGGFSGTVAFGSTTLTSAGLRDAFVAKWNPATGAFVWAQQAGGTGDDYVNGLAVGGSSVYLTGVFGGAQAAFGNVVLSNPGATSTGLVYDGYVAKLTDAGPTGSFVWAQSFGGTDREFGNAVGVSGANVYIAGLFNSPVATFGPFSLLNASTGASTANGNSDVYVARLTDAGSSGSFAWAQQLGGAGGDFCSSMVVSGASVYLAGSFNGPTATLGSFVLNNAGPNTEDVFVTKLTDAGTGPAFAWAQRAGGTGTDQALRLAVSQNNVYISGRISGSAAAFGGTVLSSAGLSDAYVAKLTDAGSSAAFTWAQSFGGPGSEDAYALAVRGSSIYASGVFGRPAVFGTTALTPQSSADVYLLRLVDAGPSASVAWAQQAGGPGAGASFAALVVGNRVFVGGVVAPPATFGPVAVGATGAASAGFLASLTDPTLTATADARSGLAFALFPNPAVGSVVVQLPAVAGTGKALIQVHDALGRLVHAETVGLPVTGLRHTVSLAGQPAGVYAVRVTAGTLAATHRLVLE